MLCFLLLFLFVNPTWASFYVWKSHKGELASPKSDYSFNELKEHFDLVVLTSPNCIPCQNLFYDLNRCQLPRDFQIAWVGSELEAYKTQNPRLTFIKTSQRKLKKLALLTPHSFLKVKNLSEPKEIMGTYSCSDLTKAL